MKKIERIGIVVAMDTEFDEIKGVMTTTTKKQIHDLFFIEGSISTKKCVVVKAEVGKVNAARATQIMIDHYELEYIINIGVAGGTNDKLKIGDVIIGKRILQHDFDITAFGHSKGYISNIGDLIKSERSLVTAFDEAIKPMKNEANYIIKLGIVATGDIFCTEVAMKHKIYAKFSADVVDMECGAVAQVCYLEKVPFISIKCICDTPYGSTVGSYNDNINLAAKRCAKIFEKILSEIE